MNKRYIHVNKIQKTFAIWDMPRKERNNIIARARANPKKMMRSWDSIPGDFKPLQFGYNTLCIYTQKS